MKRIFQKNLQNSALFVLFYAKNRKNSKFIPSNVGVVDKKAQKSTPTMLLIMSIEHFDLQLKVGMPYCKNFSLRVFFASITLFCSLFTVKLTVFASFWCKIPVLTQSFSVLSMFHVKQTRSKSIKTCLFLVKIRKFNLFRSKTGDFCARWDSRQLSPKKHS